MSDLIISVSGLRGIVGTSLTPPVAMQYATAFHYQMPDGPVLLSRDGRATGKLFADAIKATLNALGRDVIYADVAATPTLGVLVRDLKAAGGIQISASHNPPAYNGIKLFGDDGRVISALAGQQVKQRYLDEVPNWVPHEQIGFCSNEKDTTSTHLRLILDTIDADRIRERNFKVVLDSNHGAGSVLGKRLLEALDVEYEVIGDTPDGAFAHPPEPTEQNLASICKKALSFRADVVFCQDPDADRLAIIDETGRYIGEEMTLAITLKHALASRSGPVVINCATSRMSIDIASSFGCKCHISAVGEANVTEKMIEVNAVYGGEGNGGPIDPKVGYVRDSFVAMAQVLDSMASNGSSISELVEDIPQYAIVKDKVPLEPESLAQAYDAIKSEFADAEFDEQDGLRLDWDGCWLLVRPSNTEPIARIIAEAESDTEARELVDRAKRIVS